MSDCIRSWAGGDDTAATKASIKSTIHTQSAGHTPTGPRCVPGPYNHPLPVPSPHMFFFAAGHRVATSSLHRRAICPDEQTPQRYEYCRTFTIMVGWKGGVPRVSSSHDRVISDRSMPSTNSSTNRATWLWGSHPSRAGGTGCTWSCCFGSCGRYGFLLMPYPLDTTDTTYPKPSRFRR